MYVKLLNALSICETAPAFLMMKSPYTSRYGRKLSPTPLSAAAAAAVLGGVLLRLPILFLYCRLFIFIIFIIMYEDDK